MNDGYFLVRERLYWHAFMTNGIVEYILTGLLVLLLIAAMIDDLRRRIIENWLNLAIALMAPLYWWSIGMPVWPDMMIQFGIAIATFMFFTIFFALGQFGGGDLKLIGALALWFPIITLIKLLLIMSILGGVLTVIVYIWHKASKRLGAVKTPYGVAIAIAGLWAISQRYLNHFG
jgi:prepilin peptidase CpaA